MWMIIDDKMINLSKIAYFEAARTDETVFVRIYFSGLDNFIESSFALSGYKHFKDVLKESIGKKNIVQFNFNPPEELLCF